MASKKLRPGSFKSSSSGKKGATRRTGRTTGISQSAFAGYGYQPQQTVQKSGQQDAQSEDQSEKQEKDTAKDTRSTPASGSDTLDE